MVFSNIFPIKGLRNWNHWNYILQKVYQLVKNILNKSN